MEDLAAVFDPQGMFDFPDPYPLFTELRRTSPVTSFQFLNRLAYVVTRYDDVRAVLQDGETYSSRANAEVGRRPAPAATSGARGSSAGSCRTRSVASD